MNKTHLLATRILILVLALVLLPLGQALAADITVDADCSLANAIRSANGDDMVEPSLDCEAGDDSQVEGAALPGIDTITLDISGTSDGAIALDATLAVSSHIVIQGKGYSINGGGNQIFNVSAGSLTVYDLTMSNGFSIENGGAIAVSKASLSLNNSAVSGSGARGLGGGIYALDSDVTLTDSVVSGNETDASGDDYQPAQVAQTEAELTAESQEAEAIIEAEAQHAAAGEAQSETTPVDEAQAEATDEPTATPEPTPTQEVLEEVVLPDVEGTSGGGIYFAGASNTLVLERSGVDSNTTPTSGAGIFIASGSAAISNSTISSNTATGDGGGIHSEGDTVLTHVTVFGNSAANAGGIADDSILQLYNSILANNTGGDCEGSLNANLGNLIRDQSCNHDGLSSDPMLLLLAGSPAYYLPQESSPAIDAGLAAHCSPLDQRQITRQAETCDIGAAEFQAGAFSFQIQSALAAITPGGGGSGVASEETATQPEAPPAESICKDLPEHIIVTGYTPQVHCKTMSKDAIGDQTLIDNGAIYAVDIFGYVANPLRVCFAHDTGGIVLLDAANAPRNIIPLWTDTEGDAQCATVDRAGSAVLMPLAAFESGAIPEPIGDLYDCTVTTADILNLREGPTTNSRILANVLNDVTLVADKRAMSFYRVDYYGITGWLSKDYLWFSTGCQ